jgi:cyclophilin family peptidyl-prolyl cis-trans isomerase
MSGPAVARFDPMPAPLIARALSLAVALPIAAVAQRPEPSAADSALIGRILSAEDRRDSSDAAIAEGLHHGDARVRVIATRALGRIRDPRFVARDSLPALTAPPSWPEPAWRLRYRALTANCDSLAVAVADSALPVRLRAADLAGPGCASDTLLVSTLRRWAEGLSNAGTDRTRGRETWHAGAHALVALARVDADDARPRIAAAARDRQWPVRLYAARAALITKDTTVLRTLARDRDDNVKEAAVSGLSKLVGHADDEVYVQVLRAMGAQAVRAAALALKGTPREDLRSTLNATFERWVARNNASARDARVALLEAAGRPASDDRPPSSRVELPPRAVALALGADIRLRVRLASSSAGGGGGGSFTVRLRGDVAPITAARILALARSGYYNGLSWHRVEHDFVIQGGSPDANEYVGYAQYFRDELGTVPHVRGTVGMSTRGHDTGDAQWFVNLRDNLRLGRDYTVFGEVVDGMDVVDGVLEGDIIASIDEIAGR